MPLGSALKSPSEGGRGEKEEAVVGGGEGGSLVNYTGAGGRGGERRKVLMQCRVFK